MALMYFRRERYIAPPDFVYYLDGGSTWVAFVRQKRALQRRVGGQRVASVGTFLSAPPRTVRARFPSTPLSSAISAHRFVTQRPTGVDVGVALVADHQRFALARRHHLDPRGLLSPSSFAEILQGSDVMHLDVGPGAAKLASVCQKALFDLRP